jgi:hypothetical protein
LAYPSNGKLKTENMKTITLFVLIVAGTLSLQAQQDTTRTGVKEKNIFTVKEDSVGTKVKVGSNSGIEVVANHRGDTVSIRFGNRTFDVIDGDRGTQITTSREPREKRWKDRIFNGHWAGMEMGVNVVSNVDYSPYKETTYGEFFDLNQGKSLTFNMNIAEFAFSNERKTIGLVSGLGFSFMDYRFDQPMTLAKDPGPGFLVPVYPEGEIKKSKLNISYLTVPLILEIATPLKLNHQRLTLAAGVIGGVNIGAHTKVKYEGAKEKDRGNFNVNPLKYELTGRLGLGEICLFANYSMTPLFREGKGPGFQPLMIGISFPNVDF